MNYIILHSNWSKKVQSSFHLCQKLRDIKRNCYANISYRNGTIRFKKAEEIKPGAILFKISLRAGGGLCALPIPLINTRLGNLKTPVNGIKPHKSWVFQIWHVVVICNLKLLQGQAVKWFDTRIQFMPSLWSFLTRVILGQYE